MAAGEITVSLLASTGSFDTDIQRSTKAAERRMKEMKQTAAQWGAAMGAAFSGVAVAGVYMAKQLIDGIDALNDVADATGSTVEKISALEDVAARTGTSMDTVSSALVKFNQSLGKADGKDDVSRALKAIGLEASALKQMDPADALLATATALSKFADDGDKARLVQELFGKSVAEVAPLLKDLADKGELVATVTTEQAKQAEAFNQQLAGMQKNVSDVGRSIMSDLLPSLAAWSSVLKEGGILAFLGLGGKQVGDPGAALQEVSGKLEKMRKLREELDPKKGIANKLNDVIFGDVGDLTRQIKVLEAEEKALRQLQATAALTGLGDTTDAMSRRARSGLASVGPLPAKAGPKGKDPDADFKTYLNNLQQQVQKTNDLTVSEKLLDDIRRGALTVSPEQKKQLEGLAQIVDKEKELASALKERMAAGRAAAMAQGDAVTAANEEYQAFIKRMKEGGPGAQLEKQRDEMKQWADALTSGSITQAEYLDGVTGRLGLVAERTEQAKSMTEEFGLVMMSSFEQAITGGGKLSDVFKGLLQDILKVIVRMTVMEPMMKRLKESLGGSGSGGGGGLGGLLGGFFGGGAQASFSGTSMGSSGFGTGMAYGNMDFGGYFADGGNPPVGKVSVVGERGPELFVPRTAGMIVPNHALGGGGEKITLINQTTGRVDKVVEQRISPSERVLLLQEARQLVAADFANGNSDISRSASRHLNVRRKLA